MKLNPVCWVAAPSQPNTPAATPLSTTMTSATRSLPPSHALRDTGPDHEVVQPAFGLLGACRGDLAGGDEADQDRLDEEAHAKHRVGSQPVAPSLVNTSLTEPEIVAPADFAISP